MAPGFLGILKSRSALAELRCATGCLETVLLKVAAGFFIEFGLIQSVITASFVL